MPPGPCRASRRRTASTALPNLFELEQAGLRGDEQAGSRAGSAPPARSDPALRYPSAGRCSPRRSSTGVNGTNVGDSATPALAAQAQRPLRNRLACDPSSASSSTTSSTDSTALVTKRQPVSRSSGSMSRVREEVLDLDGHVVGDRWELPVEPLDESSRVRRAVEEIGIAERDVLRARGHLRRGHPPSRHRAEPRGTCRRTPERSGNGGTGACSPRVASVLPVTRQAPIRHLQSGIARERRQASAIGTNAAEARARAAALLGSRRRAAALPSAMGSFHGTCELRRDRPPPRGRSR